jgi:diadenosine tetraphosphate (Ap4A) HIT family hydrolase
MRNLISQDHATKGAAPLSAHAGRPPGIRSSSAKRHVVSFFDITGDERQAMLALLDSAKLDLDAAFHPDGYNVGINDGEAAGQTVPHLHLHLIPRYAGDREDPRGGVRWVLPQKAKYWP